MMSKLKSILIVFTGSIIGSIVNMNTIKLFMNLIPPPTLDDLSSESALVSVIPLFEPKHFIGPFLAHALGSLVGAFVVSFFTKSFRLSLTVGLLFFIGGLYMVFVVPAPFWFDIIDLSIAYFPMAWLGYWLGVRLKDITEKKA